MSNMWENQLYAFGYLLTNDTNASRRPIGIDWTQWNYRQIDAYSLYVHKAETAFEYEYEGVHYLLIGHAYNPFTMEGEEGQILQTLANNIQDKALYRNYFDQITGIFALFVISKDRIITTCDCAGMMGAYYGRVNGKVYFSSHAQMIADLTSLKEDRYVSSLKKSKTFHLYGLYLPADYSPYAEIKRVLPNFEVILENGQTKLNRFYPREQYSISRDYSGIVSRVGQLLHNNMVLIAQKWTHPAISLTGGTDSKTTLSCASSVQDRFLYYSYISLSREATDAYAAKEICKSLGLKHEIYQIDTDPSHYPEFEEADTLIARQYGYLGKANVNDVCKRIALRKLFHSDIEVKSWVSEIARASRYTKYNKEKLPERMTPRILTSMYKVFTYDRWNALRTDKVFERYLVETKLQEAIQKTQYPWSEFFVWEIVFGGWGGLTLSCEHKISNYITVPYNNRGILDLMLRTPLEKRKSDQLHRDIMDCMDPRINKLGIHVVNGNETRKREIIEGLYFDIHRHLPF